MTDSEILTKIDIELGKFYFSKNSLGYEYLVDSIYLIIKEKKYIRNFNEFIYPKIAKKYDTKPKNVMWCISKLINMMYINTDEKIIEEYFNVYQDEERPSPKAFIMCISRHIVQTEETDYIIY